MKQVTSIGFGLENMEHIQLRKDEVKDFLMEGLTESAAQFGDEVFQFKSFAYLAMRLDAKANHTYGSYGTPSNKTIFDRLFETEDPVGCVELGYDDGTCAQFYIHGDMIQEYTVDEYGDLEIEFYFEDEIVLPELNGCCCEDCEE